jgi:hypothetical protein
MAGLPMVFAAEWWAQVANAKRGAAIFTPRKTDDAGSKNLLELPQDPEWYL